MSVVAMKNTVSIDVHDTTESKSASSRKDIIAFVTFQSSPFAVFRSHGIIDIAGEESGKVIFRIDPHTGELVEIDPEQLWFWTEEWQAKEREVDEELRRGDYEVFDNIDDFIDSL